MTRRQDNLVVYMNGMTCLCCGQGWYDGYESVQGVYNKTRPCEFCGHQAPAMIKQKRFHYLVKCRDKKMAKKRVKTPYEDFQEYLRSDVHKPFWMRAMPWVLAALPIIVILIAAYWMEHAR